MLDEARSLAKRLLAISWVRRAKASTERAVTEVFASNRLLSHLYHFIAYFPFSREQYAVLRGRREYYRSLARHDSTHVGLRRNIHRLEKGLVMHPRREIFATDYIDETLDYFARASEYSGGSPDRVDDSEFRWATDVLDEYFQVTADNHPTISPARSRFQQLRPSGPSGHRRPFLRSDGPKADVTWEQLEALSRQRRSVRWFEDRPVPRELLDKALMVARQAPTACNRLPYEFRIFDDPQAVPKVAGLPFGTKGYSDNIPTIVVVVAKLDAYFSARDRHAPYIDASLAAMSFALALETLGLSSCMINWPDFEPLERRMQSLLGLKVSDRPVMLIAVGFADESRMIPYSEKKTLDGIRSFNKLS